jgi:hypothetical protein
MESQTNRGCASAASPNLPIAGARRSLVELHPAAICDVTTTMVMTRDQRSL